MEFNKDSGKRFMGVRGGRKEIMKQLNKMKFQESAPRVGIMKSFFTESAAIW